MHTKKMVRRLVAGAALFLVLTGWGCSQEPAPFVCADPIGCVDVGPDEPVKFGVLQVLSGKVAPLGQEQVRGDRAGPGQASQRASGASRHPPDRG